VTETVKSPEPGFPGSKAGAAKSRVAVWDLPVRIVHWMIVGLLVGLIVTGKLGDDWLLWHMRFGQAMLTLVVFRVIWGFVGSRNARFASFLYGPADVMRYTRSFFRRPHAPHVTHNPLGGWMVIVLLVALLAQAVMGLFTNDDALWGGPLSERVTKATSDAVVAAHRRGALLSRAPQREPYCGDGDGLQALAARRRESGAWGRLHGEGERPAAGLRPGGVVPV
jgi:cytochrome b